jgi:hypothetical protein
MTSKKNADFLVFSAQVGGLFGLEAAGLCLSQLVSLHDCGPKIS